MVSTVLGGVVFYGVAGYIMWRAWPGIRCDLSRVQARRRRRRGRYSGKGDL